MTEHRCYHCGHILADINAPCPTCLPQFADCIPDGAHYSGLGKDYGGIYNPNRGPRNAPGSTSMKTQKMLDNAATASQCRELLEPSTRGAVLRSVAQWIRLRDGYSEQQHSALLAELEADEEYSL